MGKFKIGLSEATPQPHDLRRVNRPVVGLTLAGEPVVQGYLGLEVLYRVLTYEKMATLRGFYSTLNPNTFVTFDDPLTGVSRDYKAVMHEPEIGGRENTLYRNVRLVFSRLELADAYIYLP